jgi:tetratricopeptide (TPR) repeat protein
MNSKYNLVNFFTNVATLTPENKNRRLALYCLDTALQYEQSNPIIFVLLGQVLNRLYMFPEAIQNFQKAIQLKPNSFEAYQGLGMALKDSQNYNKSIECFERALSLGLPNDEANIHFNIGMCYFELEQFDMAINYLQKVIKKQPGDLEAYANIATAYLHKGELDNAELWLGRLVQFDPEYKTARALFDFLRTSK